MAHPLEKREQVRGFYVFQQHDLERAAQLADVPLPTARNWKATAKTKGDDWDMARAAAFRANGGEQERVSAVYMRLMMVIDNVIAELDEKQDVDVIEKSKILTGLGDTLSKTTAMGAKLMPSVSALAIAMEVLKLVSDVIRERKPELAPAFIELLEEVGSSLQERFS